MPPTVKLGTCAFPLSISTSPLEILVERITPSYACTGADDLPQFPKLLNQTIMRSGMRGCDAQNCCWAI
jgi:hypothetical protein